MATIHTIGNGSATTPPSAGTAPDIGALCTEFEETAMEIEAFVELLVTTAERHNEQGGDSQAYQTGYALHYSLGYMHRRLKDAVEQLHRYNAGLGEAGSAAAPDFSTVTGLIKRLNDADDKYTFSQNENRAGRLSDDDAQAMTDEFCDVQTSYTWSIIDTKALWLWEVQLKLQLLHDTLTQGTSWADKRDLKLLKSATNDLQRLRLVVEAA